MGEWIANAQRAAGVGGGAPLEEGDRHGTAHQDHRHHGGLTLVGAYRVNQQHCGRGHQRPFQQKENGSKTKASDSEWSGQSMHERDWSRLW